MNKASIPFEQTNKFSDIILKYLRNDESLRVFFDQSFSSENITKQALKKTFSSDHRQLLHQQLEKQYQLLPQKQEVINNIDRLKKLNCYTITTGHQLSLFSGPLFFMYKIIDVINMAKQLNKTDPDHVFVPVFWMATEDHDFEEIASFNFKGRGVRWDQQAQGAVGMLNTDSLSKVFREFTKILGSTVNAQDLIQIFSDAYLKNDSLADATRALVHRLFGDYGLVIIDASTPEFKRQFVPYMEKELFEELGFKSVTETILALRKMDSAFKPQVNPREINLFYLTDSFRKRIVKQDKKFRVLDTELVFTKKQIQEELTRYPERFSPNVLLRPLYQETILPNVVYVGGGGEIAYWLQLKRLFDKTELNFPILKLRSSALLLTQKQQKKLKALSISYRELFLSRSSFINHRVRQISNINIDFSSQRELLKKQFKALYQLAEQTDASFVGAVKAQEVKQLKGLDVLEKRLLKAQRIKLHDQIERMTSLQSVLFPEGQLQERILNFSAFYLFYGERFIPDLMKTIDPFELKFSIITLTE